MWYFKDLTNFAEFIGNLSSFIWVRNLCAVSLNLDDCTRWQCVTRKQIVTSVEGKSLNPCNPISGTYGIWLKTRTSDRKWLKDVSLKVRTLGTVGFGICSPCYYSVLHMVPFVPGCFLSHKSSYLQAYIPTLGSLEKKNWCWCLTFPERLEEHLLRPRTINTN